MPDPLLSSRCGAVQRHARLRCAGRRPRLTILSLLLALPLTSPLTATPATAQVQLSCGGTLLEARGAAEQERAIRRLQLSLSLEAEGPTSDAALGLLQTRLAAVRSGLQGLGVEELQVSSPSTWPLSLIHI